MKVASLFKKNSSNLDYSYVIAEIGHNHKGSLHIAKKLFEEAKKSGADAVKLQKRNKFLILKTKYWIKLLCASNKGCTFTKLFKRRCTDIGAG